MKIVNVCTSTFPDYEGGRERVIFEYSKELVKLGHKVFIITGSTEPNFIETENIEGVTFIRYKIDSRNLILLIYSVLKNLKYKVKQFVINEKVDFINCNGQLDAAAIMRLNIKYIYTLYSPVSKEIDILIKYRSKSKIKNILKYFYLNIYKYFANYLEYLGLKNAVKINSLSEYIKNEIIKIHKNINPENIIITPGGVDFNRFRKSENVKPKNKLFKNILSVRRLSPRMGLDNLIYAVQIVIEKRKYIRLSIVGDGPLKNDLSELIKKLNLENFVMLKGKISESELNRQYNDADLFVIPTKELEGFGLVTLEALACGVPVVATPVGANIEILSKFDNRLIAADMSIKSLAEVIIRGLELLETDKELSKKCIEFVKKNYSWEKYALQIIDIYNDLN